MAQTTARKSNSNWIFFFEECKELWCELCFHPTLHLLLLQNCPQSLFAESKHKPHRLVLFEMFYFCNLLELNPLKLERPPRFFLATSVCCFCKVVVCWGVHIVSPISRWTCSLDLMPPSVNEASLVSLVEKKFCFFFNSTLICLILSEHFPRSPHADLLFLLWLWGCLQKTEMYLWCCVVSWQWFFSEYWRHYR